MLKVDVAAVCGVPDRSPELLSVIFAGREDPVVIAHVYGVIPPVAWSCRLYTFPTLAGGSGVAVAIPRFPILIVNAPDVLEAAVESVALIVNGADSPTAAGIPVIVIEFVVLALSIRFAGSAPEAVAHTKGAMPPATFTVALYGPLMVPDGSAVVVI
jgi:hypothetical protein